MAAVRLACKAVGRINGPLKMAGRGEIAVLPPDPDLFEAGTVTTKVGKLVWETIRESTHLRWLLLTRQPQNIAQNLPDDWTNRGYRHVCLGIVAADADELDARLGHLLRANARWRMVLLNSSGWEPGIVSRLGGIDWLVCLGSPTDFALAEDFAGACHDAGIAFAFRHGGGKSDTPDMRSGQWNAHPFGEDVQLDQPSLPGIIVTAAQIQTPCSQPVDSDAPVECAPTTYFPAHTPRRPGNREAISVTASVPSAISPQPGFTPWEGPIDISDARTDSNAAMLEAINVPDAISDPGGGVVTRVESGERDFHSLDALVRAHLREFVAVGKALLEIRNRELWRDGGFASWAAYCQDVGDVSKNYANRLIVSAEIVTQIAGVVPIGTTLPATESQVRPLARLPDPKMRADAWDTALRAAPDGKPTAALVAEIVAEMAPAKAYRQKSTPHLNEPEAADVARDVAAILDQLQNMAHNHQPYGMIEKAVRKLRRMLRRLVGPEASEQAGKNPDCHIGKDH